MVVAIILSVLFCCIRRQIYSDISFIRSKTGRIRQNYVLHTLSVDSVGPRNSMSVGQKAKI